jgi:5'-3' exonuclease
VVRVTLVEQFREKEAEMRDAKPPVLLIDLSGIIHPAWRAIDGRASEVFDAIMTKFRMVVAKVPGALVGVCLDSPKSWRKEMEPTYKASREKLPNEFYGLCDKVQARLRQDGHLLWEAPGFEADDLLAAACEAAAKAGHDVTVATGDKDMMQLVSLDHLGQQVRILKLSTLEFMVESDVVTKTGVRPEQIGDMLALCGDTADGVKGVPSVGPVQAAKMLGQWGSLTTLYAALEADPKSCGTIADGTPPKFVLRTIRDYEIVMLARKLVTLRTDAPIKFEELYEVRKVGKTITEEDEVDEDVISKGPGPQASSEPRAAPSSVVEAPAEAMPSVGLPFSLSEPAKEAKPVIEQTGDALLSSLLAKSGYAPVAYEQALEPKDSDRAIKLALRMFNSGLYSNYPNEDAVLAAMLRARTMGIPAVSALDCFHVVKQRDGSKKLSPYAYLMVHLASKDPNCEYILPMEMSATSATWQTKHRKFPKPFDLTYTIEQAKAADLVKEGGNYFKNPEDMLTARCGAKISRRYYSGAVMGLVAFEELSEGGE